ncbi:CAAD domain-containing protein [Prochlorothrix hollandica]|uniref:CAAD domain-containing protein n=1 Tax=Prochlorothrix hollandica TaxID=1223 RepID=UPI00333FD2C8
MSQEVKPDKSKSVAETEVSSGSTELQEMLEQITSVLSLDRLQEFFDRYKPIILTVLFVLLGIFALKVVFAILEVVNQIPLLSPFFELLGMTYAAWFVYRYIWKAENRSELRQYWDAIIEQVTGKGVA